MYISRIERLLSAYAPVPACVITPQGKVSRANDKISQVFIYDGIEDGDIFALTGIKYNELATAADEEEPLIISRNDRIFRILTSTIGEKKEEPSIILYFFDITEYERTKTAYESEQICMATVNVDNFDELVTAAGGDEQVLVTAEVDKLIRAWAVKIGASLTRYREHQYLIIFEFSHLPGLCETEFAILDEVRNIETPTDFPVTLSIGIGVWGKNPLESDQFATDALDLALGRGGDQAIIKSPDKIHYYGGTAQAVEKRNKGKSRIIAHALKQLISQSSRVIIMGHKNPDMDCFGAAVGIHKVAASIGKDAYIVINTYNDALSSIYQAAKETEEYNFINTDKALDIIDDNTLVVVVDTHRPSYVECEELLTPSRKVVVIDHHRKAEEAIDNAILAYMEPYASSVSELVTEIVQYSIEKKTLSKMDAEALLAGIAVDTNRFAVKTGVRTFEAASWLRRSGADTASVKRYFQTDLASFKIKAACISNAEFIEDGIAVSICPGESANAQIVNSQVAEELLEVQGIRASFVAGRNDQGQTVISARSLGDVNVQIIMEKLGGGGHLNTAGAQVQMMPEESIDQLKEILSKVL